MNHKNLASHPQGVRWWGRLAAVVAVLTATAGLSWAQVPNAIRSVSVSNQGGAQAVRIETSQPLSRPPSGFAIQSPARIALDFPGLTNGVGRNLLDFNQGNVRSVNVVEAGDRTRVVLNLGQASNYQTRVEGNALLVLLEPSTAAAPAPVASAFAPSGNAQTLALKDIDFRRGADSTGRVIVDLANNQVGVDIRQQGRNLVVEFLRTALPEGLRRRMDVTDFGTPVKTIVATQVGDRVRLQIEPTGNWEHSAYQSDNQFVLEVREVKVDPNKLTQGPTYSGEKLSLNFQNIEVRSLLQVIADFTNFNVVTSDTVSGNVTLRLKDVPWDQALDIILEAKGLGVRKTGNVLWIAPRDEIAAREKQEFEARASIETLEPLRTQAFQLNYAKAADIAAQLGASSGGGTGNSTRLLSARGSVITEVRTNQLFVTDVPSRLAQVQEMISKLDIPIRQVLIEARIVEADERFGKSLGVRLGGGLATRGDTTSSGAVIGSNYNQVAGAPPLARTGTPLVNLPANPGTGTAATIALSLFNSGATRFLNLEISALEADGRGKIVSSPRVVTADQVKALIEQGTEFPYQVASASGATAIAFRKANLKLEVTPQITPEGNVILDVDVNKDSRGETTPQGIAINTKHVKTQVLVENGGTVVIGGIFELTERTDINKVPGLGDIPGLGNLFKSTERIANKSELLVFLSPRVITGASPLR